MANIGFNSHQIDYMKQALTVFPITGRVTVWRNPQKAYHLDCCLPKLKYGGGLVMVWALKGSFSAWVGAGAQLATKLCFSLKKKKTVVVSEPPQKPCWSKIRETMMSLGGAGKLSIKYVR